MKIAKPSEQDFDCVHDFIRGIECIVERGEFPCEDDAEPDPVRDDSSVVAWIDAQWRNVGHRWSRVLWAGKTAIDNCCDPSKNVLEYKPELVELQAAANELIERYDGPYPSIILEEKMVERSEFERLRKALKAVG